MAINEISLTNRTNYYNEVHKNCILNNSLREDNLNFDWYSPGDKTVGSTRLSHTQL